MEKSNQRTDSGERLNNPWLDPDKQLLRSQRLESIGMLAGGVAHDLNNVLVPIMVGVQLLKEERNEAKRTELLGTLEDSCKRGIGIINQVLTFARGIEGERVHFQLRHLIKDTVKIAKQSFPKDIQVKFQIDPKLWVVEGDPTQIHQVLMNLAVNARDAMPGGGVLFFEAKNVEQTEPFKWLTMRIDPGPYVRVSVQDSGRGMPVEIVDRIFEPFFTTKSRNKGTGLGLSTSVGILRSHGGLLTVKSHPGQGTEFLFFLPAKPLQTEVENAKTGSLPKGTGETILLVDDEVNILKTTGDILLKNNYRVLTAKDGAEAMAVYSRHQKEIQLVVSDIVMPYMDGVALARSLKKLAPQIKIVVSSGIVSDNAEEDHLKQFEQIGVASFIQKPYTVQELLSVVSEALEE